VTWGRVVRYRGAQATVLGSEGYAVWLWFGPWAGVVQVRARDCYATATMRACAPWEVS